ncbi:MAG TPA: VWA domain-containing protein [Pyrinomonadaceae bacterium]|nr:VWA domain-containing protein [Pyrinomonadaceae bacterium]
MSIKKVFIFLFLLVINILTISAQDDDVIKFDSSIVRLNVGVVNNRGESIINLNKDDFAIYEDGVKQSISRFEPTVAPFSVVMILDMSGSTLGFRETIRQSAFRFVDALQQDDRVAVIEFYDKVNLRNDFTTDRKIIANSISVANGRGKTQLYKALSMAMQKLAGEGKRRKAIIVLTDGIDSAARDKDRNILQDINETQMSTAIKPEANDDLNRVLNQADVQGVTIYPLALPTGDPKKLADPSPIQVAMFEVARARLQILANRTGGTLNSINRLEEMGRLYASVAADLRTLYTVEYQPAITARDGKWRTIKIEVNNPNLIARTRQGYYAK